MTKTKPTWIFVCGAYRTASTTSYQITRDIVEGTNNGIGRGYHTESRLEEFDVPGHRYVVSKVFKYLPETSPFGKTFLDEGRIRAIATIRDPRDIIVSMRTRHDGRLPSGKKSGTPFDFETTIKASFPIWLGQLTDWIDLGPEVTLVSRFDEWTRNIFGEVKRIAEHLDIDLPRKKAGNIAKSYTIRAMREKAGRVRHEGGKADPWLPSIPGVVFGTSEIYHTWLSPPERRLVQEHCKDFMERFGYV